jgi:hypothetical protein
MWDEVSTAHLVEKQTQNTSDGLQGPIKVSQITIFMYTILTPVLIV